jgi:hypothetical protein
MDDQPITIVFDLVDPVGARWDFGRAGGQAESERRFNRCRWLAGTLRPLARAQKAKARLYGAAGSLEILAD